MPSDKRLSMRKFTIRVAVVAPMFEVALGLAEPVRYEERTIEGYTLADAKRRNGIE